MQLIKLLLTLTCMVLGAQASVTRHSKAIGDVSYDKGHYKKPTCRIGVSGVVRHWKKSLWKVTVQKISSKKTVTVITRKDGSFIIPAKKGEKYSLSIRGYGYYTKKISWSKIRRKKVPGCRHSYKIKATLKRLSRCKSNPCQNNGKCYEDDNGFMCKCKSGFYPPTCNQTQPIALISGRDEDPCNSMPCLNGGGCISSKKTYECKCIHGFTGTNCELQDHTVSANYCYPNPCMHKGVCSNLDGETPYKCKCPKKYAGSRCEAPTTYDVCDSNPCANGGVCRKPRPEPGSFVCLCPIGYTGPTCKKVIDFCNPSPCQNDGECQRTKLGFLCNCTGGWTGNRCETPPLVCKNNGPCQNGGSCKLYPSESRLECKCTKNYGGTFCEKERYYKVKDCLVRTADKADINPYSIRTYLKTAKGKEIIYAKTYGPMQHADFDWDTNCWTYYNYTLASFTFKVPSGVYELVGEAPGFEKTTSEPFTVHKGKDFCPELELTPVKPKSYGKKYKPKQWWNSYD